MTDHTLYPALAQQWERGRSVLSVNRLSRPSPAGGRECRR